MKDGLTAVEVCYMLNISSTTLQNWYKWYKIKEVECPVLPMPTKVGNKNYWKKNDLGDLFKFKEWIPHGRNGVMGSVNRKYFKKKKASN